MSHSGFGYDDEQEAILEVGLNAVRHHARPFRQREFPLELAIENFELMDADSALVPQLFLMSYATDDDLVLNGVVGEVDVFDPDSRQLGLDDERVLILQHVNSRLPIPSGGRGDLTWDEFHRQLGEVVPHVPEPVVTFPAAHGLEFTGQGVIMNLS